MRRWEPDIPPSVAISQLCRDPGSGRRRQCERRSTALAARVALARSLSPSVRPLEAAAAALFLPRGPRLTSLTVESSSSSLIRKRGLTIRKRFAEARSKVSSCERDRSDRLKTEEGQGGGQTQRRDQSMTVVVGGHFTG